LRIFAAPRVGIADLGLELERGVPHGLIEEEQARTDRGMGVPDPRSNNHRSSKSI
jgi:hypothetical protein